MWVRAREQYKIQCQHTAQEVKKSSKLTTSLNLYHHENFEHGHMQRKNTAINAFRIGAGGAELGKYIKSNFTNLKFSTHFKHITVGSSFCL